VPQQLIEGDAAGQTLSPNSWIHRAKHKIVERFTRRFPVACPSRDEGFELVLVDDDYAAGDTETARLSKDEEPDSFGVDRER